MFNSRLETLTPELRNKIWNMVLVEDELIELDLRDDGRIHTPSDITYQGLTGLLRTCKQIHSECLPMLYGANKFTVKTGERYHKLLHILGKFRKLVGWNNWELLRNIEVTKTYTSGKYGTTYYELSRLPAVLQLSPKCSIDFTLHFDYLRKIKEHSKGNELLDASVTVKLQAGQGAPVSPSIIEQMASFRPTDMITYQASMQPLWEALLDCTQGYAVAREIEEAMNKMYKEWRDPKRAYSSIGWLAIE